MPSFAFFSSDAGSYKLLLRTARLLAATLLDLLMPSFAFFLKTTPLGVAELGGLGSFIGGFASAVGVSSFSATFSLLADFFLKLLLNLPMLVVLEPLAGAMLFWAKL